MGSEAWMPYSAQKKPTGRSAVAGPVVVAGRARSARMLSSSARARSTSPSSAAARSSASTGASVSRRIGFSPLSSQRCGSTARNVAPPPGVHDQRRLYAARASGSSGVGTREASASAARSMSSRPSDTGAHDGIPRRDAVAGRPAGAARLRRVAVQRGQRDDAVLVRVAAELAGDAQLVEARDLALALDPGGVVLGQRGDQSGDAVADLQREVRRRGAHQLADVVDRDLVAGGLADGALG